MVIGCFKKKRENYPEKAFDKDIQKPGFKFNPGLALIDLQTTGPSYRYLLNFVPKDEHGKCMKHDRVITYYLYERYY